MTLVELQSLTKRLDMPGFAAKQIASWLYEKKVASIDDMTNLSLKHRELLKQNYEVGAEAPVDEMRSVDGTVKYLYKVGENHFVESVCHFLFRLSSQFSFLFFAIACFALLLSYCFNVLSSNKKPLIVYGHAKKIFLILC